MIHMACELFKVISRYPIGEWDETVPLNAGTANKNYLVKAGNQTFVIRKRNPKYASDAWIRFEIEYLMHVFERKIPVPLPLMNIDGMYYCKEKESVYQMLPYIDGGAFKYRSDSDIAEGGAFLGNLHTAVMDFHPLQQKALPRYDCPSTMLKVLDHKMEEYKAIVDEKEKKILAN